jgi:hypothetical protein
MATIVKVPSGAWKAVIRKQGWPTASKTFRTKRDAQDWARRTEDEMVRGVFIDRAGSERLTLFKALERYIREVSPTKRGSTARAELHKTKALKAYLGDYNLAAITPDLVAQYRDKRLEEGKSPTTVRLELALLSHLYTIAIREWRVGLVYNPVAVKPAGNLDLPRSPCASGAPCGYQPSLLGRARARWQTAALRHQSCVGAGARASGPTGLPFSRPAPRSGVPSG